MPYVSELPSSYYSETAIPVIHNTLPTVSSEAVVADKVELRGITGILCRVYDKGSTSGYKNISVTGFPSKIIKLSNAYVVQTAYKYTRVVLGKDLKNFLEEKEELI